MIAVWTVLHGLVAIALLGAITHQGLAVWRQPAPATLFVDRFRAIPAERYATAIVALYLLTFVLGAYIYPTFVLSAKQAIADRGMRGMIGIFQIKEHIAAIGLGLLPVYWHFWRSVPLNVGVLTRRFLTSFLMLSIWWNLIVGYVLNNLRGLS
jgi:hypothetical protein